MGDPTAERPSGGPWVVLGVDIGTTSTKVVAFDADGHDWGSHSAGYPLEEPGFGQAVQDPAKILSAVLTGVNAVASAARDRGARVAGLSFSAAMHTLIGLDGHGTPLTPSLTWADSRASEQAGRLRATPDGLRIHQRTGTPIHPMSPLPKLMWFQEEDPNTFRAVRRWVGIKEYVLAHLTGEYVVDHGVASATGLFELGSHDWYPEALELAGVRREQLAELVPTRHVLTLLPSASKELGVDPDTPVVIGASDGPLANLGVGAVHPGVAACSIGTSGALRVTVENPSVDALGRVFCYELTENRWVVGGAINNGGVVLQWAGDALAPDLADAGVNQLLDVAARAPVGSGGLLMLPYLLSERAPHWSSIPRGAYVGVTHAHRREHLVRAALEGVCLQLALVLDSMQAAGNEIREIRATGGFARSELWRHMLTDALGMDVSYPDTHEGTSFGAALLGMDALGLIDGLEQAADVVHIAEVDHPDPRASATYRELLPIFSALYDALVPTYLNLRRLAPSLPVERSGDP